MIFLDSMLNMIGLAKGTITYEIFFVIIYEICFVAADFEHQTDTQKSVFNQRF
jgi:hypothetical protein